MGRVADRLGRIARRVAFGAAQAKRVGLIGARGHPRAYAAAGMEMLFDWGAAMRSVRWTLSLPSRPEGWVWSDKCCASARAVCMRSDLSVLHR